MSNIAIIVAGGSGLRLAGKTDVSEGMRGIPKQYMLLDDRSIIKHTIDRFIDHGSIDAIQVVIHENDKTIYHEHVPDHPKLLPPVIGGASRQESVFEGLKAAYDAGHDGKVLIHDAVRPFIAEDVISNVLKSVENGACSIPAHQATDTLKQADEEMRVSNTVPRAQIYCAQTPQGFWIGEILELHKQASQQQDFSFTDDASMFEAAGKNVKIVEAPSSNFKITTRQDLDLARAIINQNMDTNNQMHADIRTGNGYDVHVLVPGDGVILCGHKIDHHMRLDGHSDADVALHALTDALLGTISSGDIGSHFPPSDARWKGASSDIFLKEALRLVGNEGGQINNIDLTIICEAPKIGPHRAEMIECLAQLCDLPAQRISIKATTNEKLGFLGREEGIAAIATTTISFGMRT